jgi:uncharacterized protein (TIGR00255 family)
LLKSMTGYGRSEVTLEHVTFVVEIRSVNHRYQETYLRIPRELFPIEDDIKKKIQEQIKRGRVDCSILIEKSGSQGKRLEVDWQLAEDYFHAISQLARRFNLDDQVSLDTLLKMPDLFTSPQIQSVDPIREALLDATVDACNKLIEMRIKEGMAIKRDLMDRLATIDRLLDQIVEHAPKVIDNYRTKLLARVEDFLAGRAEMDEGRILTEIAIYADKANIEEEITRLRSHVIQFQQIMEQDEPIGRKLDFLIQEMNREINTIGSKANDLLVTQTVVELKSEIEKMREQVQNIE